MEVAGLAQRVKAESSAVTLLISMERQKPSIPDYISSLLPGRSLAENRAFCPQSASFAITELDGKFLWESASFEDGADRDSGVAVYLEHLLGGVLLLPEQRSR